MATNADVLATVQQIIVAGVRPNLDVAQLSAGTPLIKEGLGLDSAAAVELLMALEEEFDIEIDEDDVSIEVLATVGTLADFIASKSG